MASATLLYRKTSLLRLKSTSTKSPHTSLSRLTALGRLGRQNIATRMN